MRNYNGCNSYNKIIVIHGFALLNTFHTDDNMVAKICPWIVQVLIRSIREYLHSFERIKNISLPDHGQFNSGEQFKSTFQIL